MSRTPFTFAVDARVIRSGMTGVGHYVAGLLRGIAEVLSTDGNAPQFHAMVLESEASFAALQLGKSVPLSTVAADYQQHPQGEIFLHGGINRWMRQHRASVLVSPYFLSPAGPRPFARVVGVLDDLLWRTPWNYPASYRLLVETNLRAALPFAERTFTLSAAMRRSLQKHFPALQEHPPAIVPGAVDLARFRPVADDGERRAIRERHRISTDANLLVYVASFEERKNHLALLQELHALSQPAVLALFGTADNTQKRALRAAAPPWVALRFFSNTKSEVMPEVLRAADLVVFPSRAEGFGLPVLEAMASAVPCVCSKAPALREIHRGLCAAAPVSDGLFGTAVEDHLRTKATPEELAALRARAARFTWANAARKLLALVREAADLR